MKNIPPLRAFVDEDEGLLILAQSEDGLWRSLSEGVRMFWTDAEVADGVELTPRQPTVTITRPPGGMWEVYDVGGDQVSSTPDSSIAGDHVIACIRRAGGTATVFYDDRDSIENRRARKLSLDTRA